MKCKICKSDSRLVFEKMNGYIEGTFFDIYECDNCDCQFVKLDESIDLEDSYNKIYGKENQNSVYDYYYKFAEGIKSLKSPLNILKDFNPIYHGVINSLENYSVNKSSRILEIGSGLGYFTYSLRKAGFEAYGLEYSKDAAQYAKDKFGDFYFSGELSDFKKEMLSQEGFAGYDFIVATEVIEHVTDPVVFVNDVMSLLSPNGKFIFTTPNRSFEDKEIVWNSDYPPIHLWWFSNETVKSLAGSCGIKKWEIFSFKDYKRKFLYNLNRATDNKSMYNPNKKSILTKEGVSFHKKDSLKYKLLKSFPPKLQFYMIYYYRKLKFLQKGTENSDNIDTLCAIYHK